MTSEATDLRARREAVVLEHMESENVHDFDVTIGTFGHPRYEIIPTGEVYDGTEEVADTTARHARRFPISATRTIALYHADDAVIVEFDLLGTHDGEIPASPPTGPQFKCRISAFFIFEGGQRRRLRARVLRPGARSPASCSATTAPLRPERVTVR